MVSNKQLGGAAQEIRDRFRQWRKSRPFWAGLITIIAGAFMIITPMHAFRLAFVPGNGVGTALLLPALIMVMGLFMWTAPQFSTMVGMVTVILSFISLLTTDFGGFFVGMIVGMTGGALAFAWVTTPKKAKGLVPAMEVAGVPIEREPSVHVGGEVIVEAPGESPARVDAPEGQEKPG